uniref:Uncharacterized protein n=1 Tax=viral metagenome TaxID=1070528 RepID=A0A6C0BDA8_9ZZZZ
MQKRKLQELQKLQKLQELQELQELSVQTELWYLFNEKYLLNFVKNFFQDIKEGQTFVLHKSKDIFREMKLLKIYIYNEPKPEYHLFLFKNEYDKYEIFVQKYVDNQMVKWYHEKVKCKEEFCECNNILVSVDNLYLKLHMDKTAMFSDKLIHVKNEFNGANCYITRKIE